jgi:hypothetical protein
MSYALLFEIQKSSDENITKTVQFDDGSPNPAVSSVSVKAFDANNADVSSTVIDATGTIFSDSRLYFRVKAGASGARYLLKIAATMASGDKLVAYGELKINDPS